jgi:hypothetical protein
MITAASLSPPLPLPFQENRALICKHTFQIVTTTPRNSSQVLFYYHPDFHHIVCGRATAAVELTLRLRGCHVLITFLPFLITFLS